MALHRLTSITLGVPNVRETAEYYTEFGLLPSADQVSSAYAGEQLLDAPEYRFSTPDGGEQLRIVHSPRRRLMQLGVGAQDPDDLDRITASLERLELAVKRDDTSLSVEDPGSEVRVVVEIAPAYDQQPVPWPETNGPGRTDRVHQRAAGILREGGVHPRKLGHVVIGSTDEESSTRFFTEGLGFKVSDRVPFLAAFMRCSTDPVRHVWVLGRHYVGSNFFWYLKDPAGNFSEYYSDIDCIIDDQLWEPGVWEGAKGLYSWGPPPPPSFLAPEDLAGLMTGSHSPG